jgi:hypothetical protein
LIFASRRAAFVRREEKYGKLARKKESEKRLHKKEMIFGKERAKIDRVVHDRKDDE